MHSGNCEIGDKECAGDSTGNYVFKLKTENDDDDDYYDHGNQTFFIIMYRSTFYTVSYFWILFR